MAIEARADSPRPTGDFEGLPPGRRSARAAASSALVWAGLGVAALFTYFAVRDARVDDVWTSLRASNGWWLVPALATMTVAFALRAVRWQSLFAEGDRPPLGGVVRALFLGYLFNNLLPLRAGEVVRVASLRRRTRRSLGEISATVVVERAFDVLSLLVLFFLLLPWLPEVGWLRAAAMLALVVALTLLVAIAVLARWGTKPVEVGVRLFERLPFITPEHVRDSPQNLVAGLAGLRRTRIGLVAFFWTTLSWLVLAVGFWFVMLAFDLDLSPLAGLLVVIAVGLAMILPSPPAALGVFEGATVVAVTAYGVADSAALSYALVLHALNFLPFLAIGGVMLALRLARRPA